MTTGPAAVIGPAVLTPLQRDGYACITCATPLAGRASTRVGLVRGHYVYACRGGCTAAVDRTGALVLDRQGWRRAS